MDKRKYTRKEIKERKRLGYYPLSAAEQVCYIIKYAVRRAVKRLRSRLRHWLKRGKGCRHCCLWCKYYEQCSSEEVE